jgi:hypothetical protein
MSLIKKSSIQQEGNNLSIETIKHLQALLAHACNPSYSGGSDQEDLSSTKPAQANSL